MSRTSNSTGVSDVKKTVVPGHRGLDGKISERLGGGAERSQAVDVAAQRGSGEVGGTTLELGGAQRVGTNQGLVQTYFLEIGRWKLDEVVDFPTFLWLNCMHL